jgi:hypothetical protein
MKAELLDLLRYAQTVHQQFLDTVEPVAAQEPSTWERWSGKDNLAHIVFWLNWRVKQLDATLANDEAGVPVFDSNRDYNRDTFDSFRDTSWAELRAQWQLAYPRLLDQVGQLTEEQLTDPTLYKWLNNAPMWPRIVSMCYTHPLAHFNGYYIEHDMADRAIELQSAMRDRFETFAEGGMRAVGIYDLACIYAKTGHADQALSLLPQAFEIDGSLREWAPNDPDLVSLRELVDFQALTVVQ